MIVFDTETTGLLRPQDTERHLQPFLTEIYACKINRDFEVIEEFETFVRPPVPVPEEVVKITGITNEMLRGQPTFVEIYPALSDFFLGEVNMAAHNLSFDRGVLLHELERHDLQYKFPWPQNHICTVEASMPIKNKRMKLGDLHELATGTKLLDAHRAKNDVLGLVRCMQWLFEKGLIVV